MNFDDSINEDSNAEKLRDLQEFTDGIMQKYEYRMMVRRGRSNSKDNDRVSLTDDELMDLMNNADTKAANIPERLVEIYSEVETDIIADMAARISKMDFIPSAE